MSNDTSAATAPTAEAEAGQMLALLGDAFCAVDEALESGELPHGTAAALDALRDRLGEFLAPLTPDSAQRPATPTPASHFHSACT